MSCSATADAAPCVWREIGWACGSPHGCPEPFAFKDDVFFIGSPPINLFDGVAANGVVAVRELKLPLATPVPGDFVIGIRPESVRANDAGMSGRIVAVEPIGREVLYTADGAIGTIRFVEAGVDARLREGEAVALAYSPHEVLLSDEANGRRLDAPIVDA